MSRTRSVASSDSPTTQHPHAVVKVAVIAFLLLFAYMSFNGIEEWPFTGWRLYSRPRGPVSTRYDAYAVDREGHEHKIDFWQLSIAYRHTPLLLNRFPRYSQRRREQVCAGIVEGEREAGRPIALIRVYFVREVIHVVDHEPVERTTRKLAYECADARDR